jgi:transposase
MASRGLVPIFWPPFSLDLSPIENIWNRMKDILEQLDPQVHRNLQRLKDAVWRAWEAVTDAEVIAEIKTMH